MALVRQSHEPHCGMFGKPVSGKNNRNVAPWACAGFPLKSTKDLSSKEQALLASAALPSGHTPIASRLELKR